MNFWDSKLCNCLVGEGKIFFPEESGICPLLPFYVVTTT